MLRRRFAFFLVTGLLPAIPVAGAQTRDYPSYPSLEDTAAPGTTSETLPPPLEEPPPQKVLGGNVDVTPVPNPEPAAAAPAATIEPASERAAAAESMPPTTPEPAAEAPPPVVAEPAAAEAPKPVVSAKPFKKPYRVWIYQENGDCLSRIAEKVYGDKSKWRLIYLANKDVIKDPNRIYPKQKLKIPPADWQPENNGY